MSPSKSKSKDKPYGLVREICEKLGYQSDIKNDRHMDVLRNRAGAHRALFIDSSLGQRKFPLEYKQKDAQTCAAYFVASYPELFAARSPTPSKTWPTLPDDKVFIIDELAKLMCTQEAMRLRNLDYANAKKRREATQKRRTSTIHENESDSDQTSETASFNNTRHSVGLEPDPVEISSDEPDEANESEEYDSGEQERLRISNNTQIHLKYAYPLDDSVQDGKSCDWIFNSDRWPADVEPFAFRYLHERNIYNGRPENMKALHSFSKDFIKHMCLECTELEEKLVFKKCETLVQKVARKWHQDYGFLTKIKNVLRKTPAFQKEWDTQRSKWLIKKHHGRTEHLIEIVQPVSRINAPSTKRAADPLTPENDDDMNKRPPSKRMSLNENYRSRQDSVSQTPETLFGVDNANSDIVDQVNVLSPLSVYSGHLSPPPIPPSQGTSGGIRSASHLQEKQPQILSPRGDSLHSQFENQRSSANNRTEPNTADAKATSMKSKKVVLQFIIENEKGVPDLNEEKIVLGSFFRKASLSEFFTLVSTRSGKPLDILTSLTFRYDWGNRHAELFVRESGEDAWNKFKTGVINYFRLSRAERSNRDNFDVWVRCGNTISVNEEEGDDSE